MNETNAEIFMAPGKWSLNMIMTIFEIPANQLNGTVYTGIAFIIAIIAWLRVLRFLVEIAKSSLSSK